MFSRQHRLSRGGFAALSAATRRSTPHFSISYMPGARAGGGCAVVVSKKVAPQAVDRNLLKRRVRAAILPWCKPHLAIVVYAKGGSAGLPFRTLKAELQSVFGTLA